MFNLKKVFKFWLLTLVLFGLAVASGFILDNYYSNDTVFNIILPFMFLFILASVLLILQGYLRLFVYLTHKAANYRQKITKK